MEQYLNFLTSKIKVAEKTGVDIDTTLLHQSTKPHQRDIIDWSLSLGRALIAADCGMGKSHMAIESFRMLHLLHGGKYLIVTELGAADTFIDDDPEVGEGARLGVKLDYVTCQAEAFESECYIIVTNYERVRMGEFDFAAFAGVWLDEGNYIKNMASETTEALGKQLQKVKYKYIATATPSPNETLELVNYAHVLGVCDRGQILTRYFQRNSVKAGELTLHPQHSDDFWLWVSSWAVFITRPSDLGYDDEGYELPALNVHWIEVEMDKHIEGGVTRDGQKKIFRESSDSLPDAARIKRESINVRLNKAVDIMYGDAADAADHWIIWHHLEAEREAINIALKRDSSYADIYGKMDWRLREKHIVNFSKGSLAKLATKPEISGVGCNFQKHCHKNILLGVNDSFNDLYQLIKRTHRFGQLHDVEVYILYVPSEYDKVQNLKRKWQEHNDQRSILRDIVLKYGLNQSEYIEQKKRTFLQKLADNSVDMILTSIPFGNHYEYTDKYNDFGHNASNAEFFKQMDFLVPELLRVLKPGRIAALHTKNRIHYGSVTGLGFSIFHRFTHAVCDNMEKNGFHTLGFHYVPTDVVAENNQTYRLGYSEACKDMTKMGSGIPEEVWIFRKAPTSNGDAYADEPVIHSKEDYSISEWQIDADSFWGSSGNRYLTPQEMKSWGLDKIQAWWKKFNKNTVYDYEKHVQLLQDLDSSKKLSRSFTTLPMQSNTDFIWNDVNRMHGLNMEQSRRKQQNHICPMPFDQVDRLIELYSNKGDLILEPFAGLGTTGVRAIKKERKAYLCELNDVYARCAATYLKEAEYRNELPTLFDMITDKVAV
jgi:DNA modification methylase